MAASGPFCLVCEQSHVVKPAVIWCNICEGLCEECSLVHKFVKGCSSPLHTTISVDNRKKLPTFIAEIKQICEDHSEPFVLYCSIHDEPCCSQCSATKHSTCSGFRSLAVMTENAAYSAALTDIENDIDRLSKNSEIIRSNRQSALKKYQEQVNSLTSSLKSLRKNMINVFDQAEKDLIIKVGRIGKPYTEELENIKSAMQNLIVKLEDMRNCLTHMKSFGTSYQIFAGTRKLNTEINKGERLLEDLLIDGNVLKQRDITFKFKFAVLAELITKAVDFEIEEVNCTLTLLGNQSIQTQLKSHKISKIDDINLSKVRSFDFSNSDSERNVVGCIFLRDRRFAPTDRSQNNEVVLCKENGKRGQTFKLQNKPYGISRHDQHLAAVTLPDLKQGMLLDLDTAEQKGKITFKRKCWGVASDGTQRFIREYEGGIHCIDNTGKILNTLHTDGYITHVAYSEGKLYYTQHDPDLVTCCTVDGYEVWQISTTGKPYGITIGKYGFVFVVLKTSKKVIAINSNGNITRDLISYSEYDSPFAVDYDLERDKLLVVKDTTGLLEIYDVLYE